MKEKFSQKRILYIAILLLLIFGALFLFFILPILREPPYQPEIVEVIIEPEPTPPPSPEPEPVAPEPEPEREPPPPLVANARERTGNEHIVAYIQIPGTAVEYPVVHYYDNLFYLYHDLYGQRTSAGSIFLDYLSSPDFSDRSSILYGHNMLDGSKFHNLRFFRDSEFLSEFLEENRQIAITTAYERLYYDLFSVFITHIRFNYIQVDFADDDDFLSLATEIKARSDYPFGLDIAGDDRILILSTCWGPIGTNYRLVVVGRLAE